MRRALPIAHSAGCGRGARAKHALLSIALHAQRSMTRSTVTHSLGAWIAALSAALLAACATMPPGADYPKEASTALAHPDETSIGRSVEALAKAHRGLSGFRLFA